MVKNSRENKLKALLKIGILIVLPVFYANISLAQDMTVEQYIGRYKDIAVREMKKYHIPASITLAQGILESGTGNSELARKANNHFGIKCHEGWDGKTFHMDDDRKHECFRKYKEAEDSYIDHSTFLSGRPRYAFLFDLDPSDYRGWAYGLKKAGYATNPRYPELLIKIIEENELYKFDSKEKRPEVVANRTTKDKKTALEPRAGEIIFPLVETTSSGRKVYKNNGSKIIYARQGDTFEGLAREFGIYKWQIYKYNDLSRKAHILEGQVIYLEKKRAKSDIAYHIMEQGEKLEDVSVRYGVRLNKLRHLNGLARHYIPKTGEKILLK